MNSIISNIFGIQLSKMLDFDVSIDLIIFENIFYWLLKVSKTTLIKFFIINIIIKYSFIKMNEKNV